MPIAGIIFLAIMVLSGAWMLIVSARDMLRLDPSQRATAVQFISGTASPAAKEVFKRFIKRAAIVFAGWFVVGMLASIYVFVTK